MDLGLEPMAAVGGGLGFLFAVIVDRFFKFVSKIRGNTDVFEQMMQTMADSSSRQTEILRMLTSDQKDIAKTVTRIDAKLSGASR